MRKIMLLTPIAASAALVLLAAGPAFADPDAGTGTTFEITGGTLDISAPAGPVNLGTGEATVDGAPIIGSLGSVTVTDNRGNTLGWGTTALSTDFAAGALTVPATAVSYAETVAQTTGTVTVTPAAVADLSTASPVETATGVAGANTATWNPNLSIAVPPGTQTGLYTATLTHSVL